MWRHVGIGLLAIAGLSGCETSTVTTGTSENGISIPYDPYDFDLQEIEMRARAHCGAFDKIAVFRTDTGESREVRWRYRYYDCI